MRVVVTESYKLLLYQRLASFFCKGFCGLCCKYSTLLYIVKAVIDNM